MSLTTKGTKTTYKSFEAGQFALDEVDRIVSLEFGEVFESWADVVSGWPDFLRSGVTAHGREK
eukprot:1373067-Amphidinium_carterae.1